MTLFTRISEGNPGSDWKQFVGSNKSSDVTKFLCPLFVSFFILSLQRAESSLLLKAAGVINKSLARVGILDSFAAMDGLKFMTDRVFIWSRDTEFRLCWLKHLNNKSKFGRCVIYRHYHVRYDMTNSHHMLLYCYTDSYLEAYKLPIFLVECY